VIFTADAENTVGQAVAIREGRIVKVGSNRAVRAMIGTATKVIDLGGRMAMPGLVDGHIHPFNGGRMLRSCNLQYSPLTETQFLARIQACLDAEPDASDSAILNVVGWYRQYMQPAGTEADRYTLDKLRTRRPIAVTNRDLHSVLLNSRALELVGIDDTTTNPNGGQIVRNPQGKATGILEDAAIGFLYKVMPPPKADDDRQDLEAAIKAMAQAGVTTFLDALTTRDKLPFYAEMADAGRLTARVHLAYLLDTRGQNNTDNLIAEAIDVRKAFDRPSQGVMPTIRVDHVKLVMDGVIQAPAQTAALVEPYWVPQAGLGHDHSDHPDSQRQWAPGTNRGPIYMETAQLRDIVLGLSKAAIDPHIHAIGDRAVKRTLDALEQVRAAGAPGSFRPAIAHAELVEPVDLPRFKAIGAIPVMSYQWSIPGPNSVTGAKYQLGPERFERMEPFDKLVRAGVKVAYGSDWPVDRMNYWLALKGGITRAGGRDTPAEFAGRLNRAPGLSRVQALRSITIDGAYALHAETEVGSLEPGKLADLIVLERNFLRVPANTLAENRVLLTMVGGTVVNDLGVLASKVTAQKED
jgi:predicted amidohydrolase YtcJ